MNWFWDRQRSARIGQQLLSDMPTIAGGHDLGRVDFGAAAAAATARRSVHAAVCGDRNSERMRRLRWADMLRQAWAQGAEKLFIVDIDGAHAEVDVTLGRFAAELDVLDSLAPLLRDERVADKTKLELHEGAIKAMARKPDAAQ